MAFDDRKKRILEHLQLSSEIIKPKQSKIKRQVPSVPVVTSPEPEESQEDIAEENKEDTAIADTSENPMEEVVETPKPPKTIPTRKATKEDKKRKIMAHIKSSGGLDPNSTQSKDQQRKQQIQAHLRKSL